MARKPRLYSKKTRDVPTDAVYIGRPSKWGNLYSHQPGTLARFQVRTRDEAIERFEHDLLRNPEWCDTVRRELRGKDLVCWCVPQKCHGEALLRVANDVPIERFRGSYEFLSNFHALPQQIVYEGFPSWSTEAAFQAAKTTDRTSRRDIAAMSASASKKAGRVVPLRAGWDEQRDQVMLDVLRLKFAVPELRAMLRSTGRSRLVEGNTWHDSYWGSCTCGRCGVGQNKLGRLLERVREEIEQPETQDDDLAWFV